MRISDWSSDVCSSDLHLICAAYLQHRIDIVGACHRGNGKAAVGEMAGGAQFRLQVAGDDFQLDPQRGGVGAKALHEPGAPPGGGDEETQRLHVRHPQASSRRWMKAPAAPRWRVAPRSMASARSASADRPLGRWEEQTSELQSQM